jgi:hypothetical protein
MRQLGHRKTQQHAKLPDLPVPAKCCARGSTVADRPPGGRRVRYIVSSRLRCKLRDAGCRLQEGAFSTLDIY